MRQVTAARLGEERGESGLVITAGAVEDEMDRRRLEQRRAHEQQRHGEWLRLQPRGERAHGMAGMIDQHVVVEDLAEAPQVHHRHGIRSRLCAIVILFQAQQDCRVAVRGGEVAAATLVPKMEVERVLQPARPAEPVEIEIGFVKIKQAADEKRVVGGEPMNAGRALAITQIALLKRV